MNRMLTLAALGAAVVIGLLATQPATAKKGGSQACSAFQLQITTRSQQSKAIYRAREIPAGWTVVGGSGGVKGDGHKDTGLYVIACHPYTPPPPPAE